MSFLVRRRLLLPIIFVCLLGIIGVVFLVGNILSPSTEKPETFLLSNGMQVIAIPIHKVPAVSHMVWYKVGALDEPPGKSGIAHFLEHLMFKGTEKFGPGELTKRVASYGGDDNAFTGEDYTAYYQDVPVDKLPLVMELEADRMRGLLLDRNDVMTERDVILEERRSRTDNVPASLLVEKMRHSLFPDHHYGIPVIGWKEEMEELTREDALKMYETYYSPNNAILVVAGDITVRQLKKLAEKYYGDIPQSTIPPRVLPETLGPVTASLLVHKDPLVTRPEWMRYYRAPSKKWGDTHRTEALEVLSQVLGGGETSRLYKTLVLDRQIAVNAGAGYSDLALGPSVLALYAIPKEGTSLQALEKGVEEVIATLIKEGIAEDELRRAKTVLKADALYGRDGFKTQALLYGEVAVLGLPMDYVEAWPSRIDLVKSEDVLDAARVVLAEENEVTGYLMPDKSKPGAAKQSAMMPDAMGAGDSHVR